MADSQLPNSVSSFCVCKIWSWDLKINFYLKKRKTWPWNLRCFIFETCSKSLFLWDPGDSFYLSSCKSCKPVNSLCSAPGKRGAAALSVPGHLHPRLPSGFHPLLAEPSTLQLPSLRTSFFLLCPLSTYLSETLLFRSKVSYALFRLF